jgi:hypothetical protein
VYGNTPLSTEQLKAIADVRTPVPTTAERLATENANLRWAMRGLYEAARLGLACAQGERISKSEIEWMKLQILKAEKVLK